MDIHQIRENYTKSTLEVENVLKNPIEQFSKWLKEAIESETSEPTALTVATANKEGVPSARIVLLKYVQDNGFIFFTNYNSTKGKELLENPHASMVFFWPELQRQVNVKGIVKKVSSKLSDDYFYSRPTDSQIGALASNQSEIISSREIIEEKIKNITAQNTTITRPDNWGGYLLEPSEIEFWQGRANRLHDRIQFKKRATNDWGIERLSP